MKVNRIIFFIPCLNEEKTIEDTILLIKNSLLSIDFINYEIYVFDNNSTDNSYKIANEAGANIIQVLEKGKGRVFKSFQEYFNKIFNNEINKENQTIYIMIDGDNTYKVNGELLNNIIKLIEKDNVDTIIGDRLSTTYLTENTRPFHGFGNILIMKIINKIWKSDYKDILSGFRVFSNNFLLQYNCDVNGFQLETSLAIFSAKNKENIITKSLPIQYEERNKNNPSKLKTFKDGIKILIYIFNKIFGGINGS